MAGPNLDKLPLPDSNDLAGALFLIRKNFVNLVSYFRDNSQLERFVHLKFVITSGSDRVKIKHGLGIIPRDILITRLLAPSGAKLTLHHGEFTTTDIVVSATSGDINVRMFVGTFNGDSAQDTLGDDTDQEFKAVF